MELFLILFIIVVAYIVAAAVVAKHTTEKLQAHSGLFGVGIVSIVFGFVLYACFFQVDSWLLFFIRLGFLILGIGGIIMVAIDLLKAIGDIGDYLSREDDKIRKNVNTPETKAPAAQPESLPTWKRIQMDAEEQTKDAK